MILTARIIGSTQEFAWSQIHIFSPQEEAKEKKYGSLLAIISLSQEEISVDLAAYGKEIISRLQEEYYGQKIISSHLAHLQESVQKISQEALSQNKALQLTLVVAVVLENILYLALIGQGKIFLLREKKLAAILSSNKPQLITASGFIKNNDLFILGTAEFFQVIDSKTLLQSLQNQSPKKAAEKLTPLIHAQNQISKKAAIIGQVKFLQPQKIHPSPQFHPKRRPSVGRVKGPLLSLKKLKSFFQKALSLLKKPFEKVEPIYLKAEKQKQKKMMISVGIVFLFLFLVSALFGAWKRVNTQKQERFNQLFSEIEYRLEQGQSLSEINPSLAKTRLEEVLSLLAENKKNFQKETKFKEKLNEIEKNIQELLKEVKREYIFSELPFFLDLGLIKKNLKARDLSLSHGQLFIIAQDGTVIRLASDTKASQILGKAEGADLISVDNEKIFLSSQEDIQQLVNQKTKTIIEKEEINGRIIDLDSFAGSLYLLEKSRKEIFKFPVIEEGFGRRQRWLSPGVELKQEPISFAIDSSLWVATKDNEIKKFTRGEIDPFTLENLDTPLSNLVDIFTDESSQFLYLLEKNRLVVFAKNGQYQSVYQWKNEEPEKVIADEKNKKIFLIKEEKIWELEMK